MSGFFENQLRAAGSAFFGSPYLRDFQHASQVFRSNGYAYSPKFKFLFHVYFDINTTGIGSFGDFTSNKDHNFGLAVKSIQLPKYQFDLATLNQYNRKRIIQTKIKYDPIQITFHDDNANLIRNMWYSYYSYHYKDPSQVDPVLGPSMPTAPGSASASPPTDLNERNIYNKSIAGSDDWGYVGEPSITGQVKTPFFKSINIYGFNQHNFVLYKLINPTIESFGHDIYNYSENAVMENQMSLTFETVKYFDGAIDGKNPGQIVNSFADSDHYDLTLSPIARPGSNASIMGQGGLVDAAGGIMNDLENGNWLGAVQKAGATYNTFKGKDLGKLAKNEAIAGATNAAQQTPNRNTNFSFPSASSSRK